MNIKTTILATTTTSLLLATNAQAFQVIKGEDINPSQYTLFSHAQINQAQSAEQDFLNKLQDVGTETFDSFGVGTSNVNLTFPGSIANTSSNSIVATLGGSGSVLTIETSNPLTTEQLSYYWNNYNYLTPAEKINYDINYGLEQGQYSVSGKQYWQATAAANQTNTFNINFNQEIAAFGFYAYDLGDYGATLAIKLYANGQLVDTISNVHSTSLDGKYTGSAIYVGIIGEQKSDGTYQTFDRVEFVAVNSNTDTTVSTADIFAFDNMTVGTVEQLVGTTQQQLVNIAD